MGEPHYRLSDEDWKDMCDDGWIAINAYGGIAWLKEGWKIIWCSNTESESSNISQSELDKKVNMLNEAMLFV